MAGTMPAATANLQTLSAKLVKSRHSLHNTELQCAAIRKECEKARAEVEATDALIASLEAEEFKMKGAYIEVKLAFEQVHAQKHQGQRELKAARQQKTAVAKVSDALAGTVQTREYEWTKAHEQHMRAEQAARALAAKMKAVEKGKEAERRRDQQLRDEVARNSKLLRDLRRELEVIQASAASV